ncbi:Calcium-binding mitochondrial carrier protein [Wickerhamomyces ciferrii]|uniref:Calcium-binding mitochondrial carrier protein n=1 Tax=Wickerhamomyces ciferrii (strain ATCC 14091 / BCRC 22168 / CBS 111 / JCM 3599 / NBRC 0793 / NRRL Y-1031 F-60-10) TaxID=1206466 RepID=K0KP73_WICCF|nr:Calcium-binding mitochondrial carrier protein [Wickerhamomyces ciferrii]CCH44746.1 Calcium-binding mitochondrial carrier protein [Wickerhamomyces ciferrii]
MSASHKVTVAPAITGELDLNHALHILPQNFQPWRPTILSYTASLFSTVVGFPLDSIKTRMQTHPFNGIYDCLTKTIRTEGVKGLFRGVTAPLLSTSFSKSLGVSLYTAAKPYAAALQHYTIQPIQSKDSDSSRKQKIILAINNAPVSFASGFAAGAGTSLFACPFEFTKLFQQLYVLMQAELNLNPRKMPKTTFQVARQIRRCEGMLGLYSGYKFHLLRDALGSGLYFSIYETSKILIDAFSGGANAVIPGTTIPMSTLSITLAGAMSGIFSWVLVFPIDTVKSLTQRDITSNIIRELARKPPKPLLMRKLTFPTRQMYRGLSVSVTRSVITSVAFFGCFEYLMKHIA